ncbi:S-layer homology domain-containing protein [Acidaminobacterium chupaoyuni]
MNRTRRKTFSLLLALCMVLTLLPTTAFATVAESDVASIEDTGYATLAEAAAAAQSGQTITLLRDVELADTTTAANASVITLPDGVTLDGDDYTISVGAFANQSHVLGFTAGTTGITVKDITIDGNNGGTNTNAKHCINAFGAVNVTLENVTLQNSRTAGMVIMNGAHVEATNLLTSGNAWGAVNVDNNSGYGTSTPKTSFTLNSGIMDESVKVWTEKPADVSITMPTGYSAFVGVGTNLKGFTYYTSDVATLAEASITKDDPSVSTYYETLADAISGATATDTIVLIKDVDITAKITIDKSLTLDGNGKTITGVAADNGVYFEITSGTVVIKDATVTGFGSSAGTNSGVAVFKVPSGSAVTKFTADNLTINNFCRSAFDIRSGAFEITGCTIDCNNDNSAKLTKAVLAGLGSTEVTGTIEGCTITNTDNTYSDWSTGGVEVYAPATVDVVDCIMTGVEDGITANIYYGTGNVTVAVESTIINASNKALRVDGNSASQGDNTAEITVAGGNYVGNLGTNFYDANCSIAISSGNFTSDPSLYVDSGKIAKQNVQTIGGTTYNYSIEELAAEVEVVPAAPAIAAPVTEGKDEDDAASMTAAADAMENNAPAVDGLAGAAGNVAADITADDVSAATGALAAAGVDTTTGTPTVTVYVQPYLDIAVTDADAATGTLTLEITPMVKTVASTATTAGAIDLEGDVKNAVQIGTAEEMEITTPVTITIPLPSGFVTDNLKIKHDKASGATYYYAATIDNSASPVTAKFTVTHGFSTFTLAADSRTAEVAFDFNTAADDNQTFTALTVGDTLPTDSRAGSYRFDGWNFAGVSGGPYKTLTDALMTALSNVYAAQTPAHSPIEATPSFTYTGGGDGGGGVSTSYTLTFNTNGGNTISNVSKDRGTVIDLADYTPTRAGYTFDGWYSNSNLTTKITSVTLNASTTVYAKWIENSKNPFIDVATGTYYYDAVLWAVEKGITQGTSATTFSPLDYCTRGQIVTFLWRAMGEPAPTSNVCPFTDVDADAYYYDAVLWAVEKGITQGTSATTFSPNDICTRGQVVTFQYRAAGEPAVTAANPFTDVKSGDYWYNAVLWAVGKEITVGTSATTFSPLDDCTRGQIVTFLYRQLG